MIDVQLLCMSISNRSSFTVHHSNKTISNILLTFKFHFFVIIWVVQDQSLYCEYISFVIE